MIAWGHVSVGIALSVGLLPVGLMGVRPLRRQRAGPGFVGVAFAVSLLLGSLLSRNAWVAVAGMLALPLLVSLPAVRPTARRLAFALIIPGVAIGLSFPELSDALTLAWAIAAGVLWMVALSLFLPERPLTVPPPAPPANERQARIWGLMVGGAAGTATAVGEIVGVAHIGWAPTAALLVMRPQPGVLEQRSAGRVVSTLAGATAAAACVELAPAPAVLACIVAVVVIATIATRTSRWYVTSAGTSFLVLTLLLYGASLAAVNSTFWTRVGAGVLGAALAVVFGVLVPRAIAARRPVSAGAPG